MCFVPRIYRAAIHPDLTQILNFCPTVKIFNHLPPFPPPKPFPFPALPSTVTSLKLSIHDTLSAIYGTLQQCCAQLEDLSVHSHDDEMFDAPKLSFPRLHTLHLTLTGSTSVQSFSTEWDMPRLQRLTFNALYINTNSNLIPNYYHILAVHGRSLKYVAFYRGSTVTDFAPLLAMCPVVEHVVLPPNHYVDPHRTFPLIKWVDIWSPGKPKSTNDYRECSSYPHIEGPVRFLDTALVPLMDDVPRAFAPGARGDWALTFPGLSVRQDESDGVITIQPMDLLAALNWEFTYFGAIELRAMQRELEEQEVLEYGDDLRIAQHNAMFQEGQSSNYIESLTMQFQDMQVWDNLDESSEDDYSDGDSDDSWLSLESEDLTDLRDEFYDRL